LAELEASFDHIATDMTTHTQPTTATATGLTELEVLDAL
jgi:hypothetical protein